MYFSKTNQNRPLLHQPTIQSIGICGFLSNKQNQIMKGNNFESKISKDAFKTTNTENILAQRVDSVLKDKFSTLLQIYQANAYENGYNPILAFRVIALYLYTEVQADFNLHEEVNRFITHQLQKGTLQDVQRCMDMLMMKNLKYRLPDKDVKLWKIKIVLGLKKHYKEAGLKKQKKKASTSLKQMCQEQLKHEDVKHDQNNYNQVMDILLDQEYLILNSRKARGKFFEAIQNGNNIIRILEKAQQLLIPKYQQKLMIAYWQIARLHYHLHYQTYARKYCQITLNIAERINDKKVFTAARAMIEALNSS